MKASRFFVAVFFLVIRCRTNCFASTWPQALAAVWWVLRLKSVIG